MDHLREPLTQLGAAIADADRCLTDPGEIDAARRLWLQSRASAPARRSGPLLLAAAAFLAASVVALALVARAPASSGGAAPSPAQPGRSVSFVVGSPPESGAVGEWVAADGEERLVRFSEGTSFTLSPGATARVTEATAHGATLLLERGEVAAAVVHAGADTRWDLRAGPFDVRVTGTRFDASWDPTTQTFELTMSDGVVLVKGPLLQTGRELWAGERLRVAVREGLMDLRTASPSRPPDAPPAPPGAPPAAVSATTSPQASAEPTEDPVAGPPHPFAAASHDPTWRELAAAGKYTEALAAAEHAGFAPELERASSADLAALADAARYAARPALARQALLAQRRRFGVRGASAFVLGKIAADQQGASGEGLRWFETYLREEPRGPLAEQALGRILQMQKSDPSSARATAARYLARYPSGVHAALARRLLTP